MNTRKWDDNDCLIDIIIIQLNRSISVLIVLIEYAVNALELSLVVEFWFGKGFEVCSKKSWKMHNIHESSLWKLPTKRSTGHWFASKGNTSPVWYCSSNTKPDSLFQQTNGRLTFYNLKRLYAISFFIKSSYWLLHNEKWQKLVNTSWVWINVILASLYWILLLI